MLTFGINVTIPLSHGSVFCGNNNTMDAQLLKPGNHRMAMEWVWDLKAFDSSDQKAMQACGRLIMAGWGCGETNLFKNTTFSYTSATMYSNTTIICNQQVSTGQFMVRVDGEGRMKRSKLIGELKYDDRRIFYYSTSARNFTAQLAMLHVEPPWNRLDYGIMHNDNSFHSFSHLIGEYLVTKTLSDSSPPSPRFEDAQHALSKFYKHFFPIVLSQNLNRIFVPAGNVRRSAVGQLNSIQPRMSMDSVMLYIAVVILGFHLIARTIISHGRLGASC